MIEPEAWDGHIMLLHAHGSERRQGLAGWVRRGLDADEKVVFTEVADGAMRQPLLSVLEAEGIDGAAAKADGRLVLMPPSDFYPAEVAGRLVDEALAEGFRGVRTGADDQVALTVLTPEAQLDVEQAVDVLCSTREMSCICLYQRSRVQGEQLLSTAATHLHLHAGALRCRGSRDRLALTGEIDGSNHDVLDSAVRTALRRVQGTLHIDLSGVSFMDVRAVLTLMKATEEFRAAGGLVRLGSPTRAVERVLTTLDVDSASGVELGADS